MTLAGMLPHQVEILYDFEGGGNATVCAGTIISSYLVLTVFSCLAGRNESLFKIRANGKNQNEGQIRTIDQVYSYAALDSEASPFDVAVIRLNSKLALDNTHTSKIRYDQSQVAVDEDLFCEASAGRQTGETEMREVKTIDTSHCSEILEGRDEKDFVCTEPAEVEDEDSRHESKNFQPPFPFPLAGSSLICSDVLYGVFAMNSSKAEGTHGKRLYTSIAQYSHWIRFVFDETEHEMLNPAFDVAATSFGGKVVDQIKSPVPYQLSIQFQGSHSCGGIILDQRTALSAAHCFTSRNIPLYTVVAGETSLNETDSTEQIFRIEKLYKHPNYRRIEGGNDIAVIRIKGKFNFNQRVNNVWISSPSTPDFQDFNGTATGWGKTETGGGPSPVLMSVELELLEHSTCKKKWGFLRNSMLCGYSNVSNTCEGDSGGPLVIKNYEDGNGNGPHTKKDRDLLVGIASFGPRRCEEENMPNGFTSVSHFYEWIAEKRSSSSCSPCQFQCFSGQCIHRDLKCDKTFDCDDGSDEKVCKFHSPAPLSNMTSCGKMEVDQTKNPVPYQLSIQLNGSHVCGGVILDKKTALSLSGCFSQDISEYTVVAGETNLNEIDSTEQILRIEKVVKHPEYKRNFLGNDIAVIHVQGEFGFNDRVNNVWISSRSTPHFQDVTGVATGWSRTRTHGPLSPVLKSLELEFMEREKCKTRWPFLTDSMLCGYNHFSNICGGDAGSPLVIKNYVDGNGHGPHTKQDLLVGISTSGPSSCEEKDQINGFTNVAHFYKWIAESRQLPNSLCSSAQFQCLNGECINKELKCDETFDCADGSDEKVCSSISHACGGFINLAQSSQHEIIYQVPSKERQRDSVCLWIISTGRQDSGASIEATILDNPSAQFNPDSDVIFTQYKFTLNKTEYSTLNEAGRKYTMSGPFMTVYYRTNSLASNAGFHLKLKDDHSITQRKSTERLNVTLITLPNGHFGGTRKLWYPSSRNAIRRDVTYSRNERTFFILKPQKSGAKIRLNLTFVDTEEKYDWLQINSFRTAPFSLFSFSGRSNWTEQIFEGLEDEPFLFYFHSDGSVEREGFKIQYSEMMQKTSPCGGFIRFGGEQEILYKVPENLRGEKSVCVWVVTAAEGSSIETEVLSNPRAHFEHEESDLYAIFDFTIRGFSHHNRWAKDQNWTVEKPFFVLYFRTTSSNPNSGFHIRLKEVGETEEPETVKYLEMTPTLKDGTAQEFKYPQPPASKYKDNERTFIIVKPGTPHGKLKLDLKSVNTEKDYDWMDILSVKSEPTSELRFHGQDSWANRVFEVENDEPFIVYFHSDTSNTDAGFQFSYAEETREPEELEHTS